MHHDQAGDITILYGSQTGNAEDLAKRIGYQAKTRGFNVLVEAIDDFPIKLLPKQKIVLFVCSTTGHGQEPENMKLFYNFIRRRDLPKTCLSGLKFAVYGLGSSSYAKFNYVSKIVYKRLLECGASPIHELALGDEQHSNGCDGAIYPKLDDLWATIQSSDISVLKQPDCSYDAILHDPSSTQDRYNCDKFTKNFEEKYDLKTARCIGNQRLTSDDHFQDTRHLSFEVSDDIHYDPGDVCTILPENSDANVRTFIEALGLNSDQRFSITKKDPRYMTNYLYDFIPDGLKIWDLVKYHLDIQSTPRRSFFEFIWFFSSSELEREKLKELSTTEGQEELYEYCTRPKRSILEVLLDFPHTIKNIEFKYLFDIIPPIKTRSFSIASCIAAHPKQIHLLVGVVKYKTIMKKERLGLCSNYLAAMEPNGDILTFYLRQTAFKLPKDSRTPVIMIGPGLGLAPMRSFMESRSTEPETKGRNYLYFGCRNQHKDFYFEEELKIYASTGYLELRVAFSRQDPKSYVQDLIVEDAHKVKQLIYDDQAILYIAGNSKLPEDIRSTLIKILDTEDVSDDIRSRQALDVESYILDLENQNRIQYDCW